MAASCPEPPRKNEKAVESARWIEPGEENSAASGTLNPWVLTVTSNEEGSNPTAGTLPQRDPTYKVTLEVDGVKTRALINHGARELLPIIQQKQDWAIEQYRDRNLELDRQPVGASGEALGVMVIVVLKITVEGAKSPFYVPCYVLQSCKPLWKGELYDCALVLGTNALETMGFSLTENWWTQLGNVSQ